MGTLHPRKMEGTEQMNERDYAVMEGKKNAASDRYFLARPDFDTPTNRKIFEDGFVRAYRLLHEERKE